MGRRRLPPAPAMKAPISWTRATGESISAAIAASTACSSGPTASDTRSFSSVSSWRRAFHETGGGAGASTDDDAVFDLDLRSRWMAVDLHDRELVVDLAHFARRHFLVQLAQELAGDGWTMATLSRRTLTTLPGRIPSLAVRSTTTRVVSTKTT